ncbi:glycosyltransferase [Zafaria sp. J156]|uniref:glycosyltransferase n=1 Tax=Zafaria sp. J156 TaxID=3116490 RepID=UPI002E77774E|nr:glycosyltransferase [Zafaria sp. J156]MEE1620719.1 glycosyltransferase [Zafaria sp. J156]
MTAHEPNHDRGRRTIVLYGDVVLDVLDGSAIWLISMAEALSKTRSDVHVLLKSKVRNDRLLKRLHSFDGVTLHDPGPGVTEIWSGQPPELTPERAAERIAEVAAEVSASVVVVRGKAVCRQVAERPGLARRLWAYITDLPYPLQHATSYALREIGFVAERARRMFAQTEDARAYLEANVPAAAGKTLILNPMIPDEFFADLDADGVDGGADRPLELIYAGKFAKEWRTLEMCSLAPALAEHGVDARVTMIGDKFQRVRGDAHWGGAMREGLELDSVDWLGGMSREETLEHVRRADIGLGWRSPELDASLEISTKALEYAAVGTPPLLNRTAAHEALLGADYPLFLDRDDVAELVRVLSQDAGLIRSARRRAQDSVRWYALSASAERLEGHLAAAETELPARADATPHTAPLKVLLAGHDLKFAGELIEMLEAHPLIELRFDEWPSLHVHDEARSAELLGWADVVLCEWAGKNAVWYSQRKRPGQRLLVRLHGFEVRAPWLSEIDFDAVDGLLTVSRLMVDRVEAATGWDAAKIHVVPNALDVRDLGRSKLPGSGHRLGLVGIVPFLKRPDRALDALELLLDQDPCYTLHIRGRLPWEYPHVWAKAVEQEAYLSFFERVGRSARLRDAVVFEPFGADMGSWLRKIGFVLSPSSDESFHLAPAEGMASGAVPIVWDRPGSADVFGEDLVVADAAAAAEKILAYGADPESYHEAALGMRDRARTWDLRSVNRLWLGHLGVG